MPTLGERFWTTESSLRQQDESLGHVTRDDFLGGALHILQPATGYRSGIDAVLLAASVPARPGEDILDLGCGAGVAGLCIASRVPGTNISGLELQAAYANLARLNAAENKLNLHVHDGDVASPPEALKAAQFDHVIANPPYFQRSKSTPAPDNGRDTALGGDTPLCDWVKTAAKRTKPKGCVTFIQRADRTAELIACALPYLGSLELLPLAPRIGKNAKLVLLRGRRGVNADFRLHAPWYLHAGERHTTDAENYTEATSCVLRHGFALLFPD